MARALLEHETIDGTEVTRLLELASPGSTAGNPHSVLINANGSNGSNGAVGEHDSHAPPSSPDSFS